MYFLLYNEPAPVIEILENVVKKKRDDALDQQTRGKHQSNSQKAQESYLLKMREEDIFCFPAKTLYCRETFYSICSRK